MNLWYTITKKSSVGRKAIASLKQIPRACHRLNSSEAAFSGAPPVLANSFPKSGTHLMTQILETLPGLKDYGSFIASMPTLTYRERSEWKHKKLIGLIVPGELVRAHLFYNSLYSDDLERCKCVHFFIYRDPRDVCVSEAFYLAGMNRWHRLHKYFKALADWDERILFSILGENSPDFPYVYPDIAQRFERYRGWLEKENVFPVRYEDLISEGRTATVRRMIEFYLNRANPGSSQGALLDQALKNIDPEKSHTYREGKKGKWKDYFTSEHRRRFKEVAGTLLIELGYEEGLDW